MRTWTTVTAVVAACGLVVGGRDPRVRGRVLGAFQPPLAAVAATSVEPLGESHQGSLVALARVGGHEVAYVADEDDALVHIVDTVGPTEVGTAPLPGRPGQLLVLPDGRLLVAIRGGSEVAVLRIQASNLGRLVPAVSFATPLEPIGLALTPDGKSLLVASGWGRALTGIDLASGRRWLNASLPRDPRAVVTSADGSKAFVSHAVGSTVSVIELQDSGHSVVDSSVDGWSSDDRSAGFRSFRGRSFERGEFGGFSEMMKGPDSPPPIEVFINPRKACQGFSLVRVDGPSERVLAPQVEVETGEPTARSGGYGSAGGMAAEVPNIAVLPVATGIALPASMEVFRTQRTFGASFGSGASVNDDETPRQADLRPCVLPRAATTGHGQLYVACLGIDTVVEYDAGVVAPQRVEHRRWPVPAGPEGLALLDSRLFVWSQFARTLTVLDLDAVPATDGDAISPVQAALSRLPAAAAEGDVALGRQLFHATSDPRIAQDGRSCASCHPDGRDDSLTWSTPGGPRQTPMLAGRINDTAPYGWDGEGKDVTTHLTHTFQRLSGGGLKPHEVAALIAYVKSLPVPPRTPAPANAEDGKQVARGSELFHAKETGCSSCHSGDGPLTDGIAHDVESKVEADAKTDFDTPSLRFVAGTAPYFHDGRYATLRDVLTHTQGTMGRTEGLSGEDLDALEAYVETL
jgi:cytochrome c553